MLYPCATLLLGLLGEASRARCREAKAARGAAAASVSVAKRAWSPGVRDQRIGKTGGHLPNLGIPCVALSLDPVGWATNRSRVIMESGEQARWWPSGRSMCSICIHEHLEKCQ